MNQETPSTEAGSAGSCLITVGAEATNNQEVATSDPGHTNESEEPRADGEVGDDSGMLSLGSDFEVEPWPEPVKGEELLDGLVAELRRFVVVGNWIAEAFALWIVHTYAYQLRQVTTYMGIESPEKECGKSTLLTVLSRLVDRPAISANISSSAFFRTIEQLHPTLLIDEADTNLRGKDDMTGTMNAGYTKATAFVWRVSYEAGPAGNGKGGNAECGPGRVARYSCWCPKAIAGIGRLPATLASRCIVVQMHRKTSGEQCERLSRLDGRDFKRKCARFVADHRAEIASAEPVIPAGLSNRAADIWEPLLVLADLAGGRWPELARQAALGLTGKAEERSPIGSLLLDLYVLFTLKEAERLFSRDLVSGLSELGERPWRELTRGKSLTDATLARQLAKYGIKPRTMRIGRAVSRGYLVSDFTEICRRYVPRSELMALKNEAQEYEASDEQGNTAGMDLGWGI